MKIQWLGHSAFLIEDSKGKAVVTDPFEDGCYDGAVGYANIACRADIVLVSHTQHPDHCGASGIKGTPIQFDTPGNFEEKEIPLKGIATFHDKTNGSERGKNIVFKFTIDDINIAHLGDLGHILSQEQVTNLDEVDVLLAPVGGFFTIDASEAWENINIIKPKVVIPMHFKTDVLNFPIDPVDKFLDGHENIVKRIGSNYIEFTQADIPKSLEVWVLDYSQ